MKNLVQSIVVLSLIFATSCKQEQMKIDIDAPVAEKIPKQLEKHGDIRVDNYYWMRLTDEQKNAKTPDEHTQKVLDYLNAENT